MSVKLGSQAIETLMKAPDYRSFLAAVISERKKISAFGYADIARLGGLKSRSFPRDVVLGKKRITLTSLSKVIKGLGLTADLAEYFRVLVEIEEEDCRTKNFDVSKLQQLKVNLQKRIFARNTIALDRESDLNFIYSSIPKIYASLGDAGETIDGILQKTGLSEREVSESLNFMLQRKLISKSKARFVATENHLNFQNLQSDIFKNHFVKTAEESIVMSKKHIRSDEKLFLSSSFSVAKRDLPKLKEDFRSVLLKYVDHAEDPKGDRVINLIASLY
jgi:uncharacterized protein (TIGR02147 family)